MKRIFFAIKVNPEENLHKMFSAFQTGLGNESIKWMDPVNIHITLAFLGDTEESMIKIICNELKNRCLGYGAFEMIIRGAGVFKSLRDPRVIWTGIDPSEKLSGLNLIVRNSLNDAGIVLENRLFKPHLTLGRIRSLKSTGGLEQLIEIYKGVELQKVPVNELILYESILRPTGSVYKTVEKFIL